MINVSIEDKNCINYPCVMISKLSRTIVLFSKEKTGTVIFSNDFKRIGEFDTKWNMEQFKNFDGIVRLSN